MQRSRILPPTGVVWPLHEPLNRGGMAGGVVQVVPVGQVLTKEFRIWSVRQSGLT